MTGVHAFLQSLHKRGKVLMYYMVEIFSRCDYEKALVSL